MQFTYTIDPTADEPIMLINTHIGYDAEDGPGIIGELFQRELMQLDSMGKSRIQVWINSPGGSVLDGYSIYSAILKSVTKVDTYCVGMCASIAAVIFQAGRKRIMSDYGILMYHNPFGSDNQKLIESMRESIVTMICGRSGMEVDAMGRLMARTTYMTAEEAKSMNLCDEIEHSMDLNKKRAVPQMVNAQFENLYWKDCNQVLNKIIPNTKKPTMKEVTNRLKLTEDAQESSIVAAIDAVMNRAEKAEQEAQAAKDRVTELENSIQETQNKLKDMETERDSLKEANDQKELDIKKDKAKNLVAGYVASGRISKDDAQGWEEDAVADFTKVENRLKNLPVNREAAKFNHSSKTPETQFEDIAKAGAARDMAKIANKLKIS